jgi:hypothetical protein
MPDDTSTPDTRALARMLEQNNEAHYRLNELPGMAVLTRGENMTQDITSKEDTTIKVTMGLPYMVHGFDEKIERTNVATFRQYKHKLGTQVLVVSTEPHSIVLDVTEGTGGTEYIRLSHGQFKAAVLAAIDAGVLVLPQQEEHTTDVPRGWHQKGE